MTPPPPTSAHSGDSRALSSAAVDQQVRDAIARYAAGAFPMDDAHAIELPWYTAPERAIFELHPEQLAPVQRRLRRDARACADHQLTVDTAYDDVLELCAEPPPGEGIWITPRLAELYRGLHAAGAAHSFELWTPGGELAAGILGVVLGRAAMLESMRKRRPKAGNALLSRTLHLLVERGIELCDIQLPTEHTTRLGCAVISQDAFEARLARALAG